MAAGMDAIGEEDEEEGQSTGPPTTADALQSALTSGEGFPRHPLDSSELSNIPGQSFLTMSVGEQEVYHTPRTKSLLGDAEIHAEHQAIARLTMLDLAKALEQAAMKRRDLEVQIHEEKRVARDLRQEINVVEDKLEQSEEREEKLMNRRMKELMPRHEGLWFGATRWAQFAFPLGVMAPEAKTFGPRPEPTKGDYFVARDWFAAWREATAEARQARLKDQRVDDLMRKFEEERKKLIEEFEKKLEAEREISKGLDAKLQAVQQTIRQYELRTDKLEKEIAELKQQAEEAAKVSQEQIRKLEEQLDEARRTSMDLRQQNSVLEEALREAEDRFTKLEEKVAAEKKALQGQIKSLQSELQEVVVQLKHMKEIALRAKREAAGTVSPEKYAQLIADLEEMRDKLGALGQECDFERSTAAWLRSKLDQNRRRLELERQFLPLLHKVRGPVGPKNPVLKSKNADAWGSIGLGPPPTAPSNEKRMSKSMSAGFVGADRQQGGFASPALQPLS